jgi:hypothetical protein
LSFTSVATSTIPIVFANVTNAILARHYNNVTGIIAIEPQVAEKWVSILKDLVPGIERVGFLHALPSAPKEFLQSVEAAATSHGLKLVPTVASGPTLDTMIAQFAGEPNGGLVVMPSFITAILRPRIIRAAAQNRVPAIYGHRFCGRRPDFLWTRNRAVFRTGRVLHRPHPKRRNARRLAVTASLSVRFGHQPEDREDARPHHPENAVGHR